ncbi:MAG: DUF975 family protein [Candidatus Omnitrophica bacterium]|nr:DUF975 family protein [Candidatus Omnitrophota bacterium]
MASESKFSISEAFSFGWKAMKENFVFFLKALITTGLIQIILNACYEKTIKTFFPAGVIFYIASVLAGCIFYMGYVTISLKFCDKEEKKFSDIFSSYPLFFNFLFASIVNGIVVFIGLLLLIVPGIILLIRLRYFGYFIVDKSCGPIEALKKSFELTKGSTWNLFVLVLAQIGVVILGFIALFIGLFAAIPTTMVADAFVYRALLNSKEPSQGVTPSV